MPNATSRWQHHPEHTLLSMSSTCHLYLYSGCSDLHSHTKAKLMVQEVEKSLINQKVASSIPCRSALEQDTEPLIAPDVQCAISVNVKCVYILVSRFG